MKPNKRIFNNTKVSDHFAIVPTGTAPKALSDAEQKIFDLVSRRFIAVFYPAAQFEVTTRITTVESEKFKTDGKIIIDPGWLAVYGKQAESSKAADEEESDRVLVALGANERTAKTEHIEVKESVTKPPPRFNEATLLSAMEGAGKFVDDEELREAMAERGLGTPATRAQIIEGLILRGVPAAPGQGIDRHAKGALAHHAAAQSPRRGADQAGADRRMGSQAAADGARPNLARVLHGGHPPADHRHRDQGARRHGQGNHAASFTRSR